MGQKLMGHTVLILIDKPLREGLCPFYRETEAKQLDIGHIYS